MVTTTTYILNPLRTPKQAILTFTPIRLWNTAMRIHPIFTIATPIPDIPGW